MGYRTISGYERRNRNVLRRFLKIASDGGAAVTRRGIEAAIYWHTYPLS